MKNSNEEKEYSLYRCCKSDESTEVLTLGVAGAYCEDILLADSAGAVLAALVDVGSVLCTVLVVYCVSVDYFAETVFTAVICFIGRLADDYLTIGDSLFFGVLSDESGALADVCAHIVLFVNDVDITSEDTGYLII